MMRGKVFAAVLMIRVCGVIVGTELSEVVGSPRMGWLKALNISVRKSRFIRSARRKLLAMPASKLNQCGPRKMFRPEVTSRKTAPGVVGSTGTAKQLASYHWNTVG